MNASQRQTLLTPLVFVLACASEAVRAVPTVIDFGVSWPALTDARYSDPLSPYSRLIQYDAGPHSTESCIAGLLNGALGVTSITAGDVFKNDSPVELGGADGYFMVPSGWNYLVVQYDGKNGGAVVLSLGGNEARVPFDSSLIWGCGDKYAVSHYSVACKTPPVGVPDGGSALTLLGLALGSLGMVRHLLSGRSRAGFEGK